MSMTIAEAQGEIRTRVDEVKQILGKYDNGVVTDPEEKRRVDEQMAEINGLELKLADLQEGDQRRATLDALQAKYTAPIQPHRFPQPGDGGGTDRTVRSLGDLFTQDPEYLSRKQRGMFNSNSARHEFVIGLPDSLKAAMSVAAMQRKALVYSGSAVAGSLFENDRLPGVVELLNRELNLLDLIPSTPTDSDTIEYVKEDARTNAATGVAEATATTGTTGLKPEGNLAFSVATSPVITIAQWIPVTNKMLADGPAIRGLIDERLIYDLRDVLEAQVLGGTASTTSLGGILEAGISTLAAGTDTFGGIMNALVAVAVTGKVTPTNVVMHPSDFSALRTARENAATGTLGNYLYGPPSITGPMTVWGLPVTLSIGMTENTILVGNFRRGCMLFDREQPQIRVGTIDDQFVRNMQTILAELRAGFVVFRPTAFARVTGA